MKKVKFISFRLLLTVGSATATVEGIKAVPLKGQYHYSISE